MATVEECRAALQSLAAKLTANAEATRNRIDLNRPLACRITDLPATFHGRLADGQIVDLSDGDDPGAKIRLTTTSDDLIAIADGQLNVASAWASGRLKIDANVFDLITLRKLL
jgi:hypothetical protein